MTFADYLATRPERWGLVLDPPLPARTNMERDEALLQSPVPVLRLYSWQEPTLSLGCFQKDSFPGWPCVRRPSGGRALWHADEITYALVLPESGRLSVREAFCGVTRGLATALRALGASEVETCAADNIPPGRDNPSCMAVTRLGELSARGCKLAGSAQVRRGNALLQHGSLPRRLDRENLRRLWGDGQQVIDLQALGLAELRPEELARELGRVWEVTWEERGHGSANPDLATTGAVDQILSPGRCGP